MSIRVGNICKQAAAAMLCVAVAFCCAGCGAAEWEYNPVTDVNNLEGRKVGVNLSWEADYFLTGREDMELCRYDTTSDLVMALKYDKIDVIATDIDSCKLVLSISDGIEMVEPSFGTLGSVMYFGEDDEALSEDFNAFLAEFKKTGEYADFLKRLEEYDGFEYLGPDPEIPLTGTGEKLRVATDPANYPRTFVNPGESIPVGYDVEILKHYANARGYQLEFYLTSYGDGAMGLLSGTYDIMTGYISDIYNAEASYAGVYISDAMFEFPLFYLQKNKRDIKSSTEYLD